MISVKRAILKATDAKLRTDNWQYIIEVCDLVSDDPEDGGEEAIEVIEERLEQNDANVILRTLALVISLAENCGSRLRQLIDSKKFTKLLYSLVENHSVHKAVKVQIVKTVKQLAQSFQNDPSLRYMNDLLKQITRNHPLLMENNQPNIPSKHEMTQESKKKEDNELEEALKLSLREFEQQKNTLNSQVPKNSYVEPSSEQQKVRQTDKRSASPTSPAVIKKVRAMYDLTTSEPDELSFKKGDVIIVLEQVYRDWWRGTLRGNIGIFPLNYVMPIEEPTQRDIQAEMERESRLFAQKPKIDGLSNALKNYKSGNSYSDPTQDPAINNLYGSVTPLRPEIAKSIGKYARKREDLASLRQVLATAELTYNQLLDRATNAYTSSVSLPQSQTFVAPPQGQRQNNYYMPQPELTTNSMQGQQQLPQQGPYNIYTQHPQSQAQPQSQYGQPSLHGVTSGGSSYGQLQHGNQNSANQTHHQY